MGVSHAASIVTSDARETQDLKILIEVNDQASQALRTVADALKAIDAKARASMSVPNSCSS